eukprot:1184890-Prorocentrum_minimum.AAC.1
MYDPTARVVPLRTRLRRGPPDVRSDGAGRAGGRRFKLVGLSDAFAATACLFMWQFGFDTHFKENCLGKQVRPVTVQSPAVNQYQYQYSSVQYTVQRTVPQRKAQYGTASSVSRSASGSTMFRLSRRAASRAEQSSTVAANAQCSSSAVAVHTPSVPSQCGTQRGKRNVPGNRAARSAVPQKVAVQSRYSLRTVTQDGHSSSSAAAAGEGSFGARGFRQQQPQQQPPGERAEAPSGGGGAGSQGARWVYRCVH